MKYPCPACRRSICVCMLTPRTVEDDIAMRIIGFIAFVLVLFVALFNLFRIQP